MASSIERYAGLWRAGRPAGVWGIRGAWESEIRAVHGHALTHGRPGIPRPAWWPLQAWLWARWTLKEARSAVDEATVLFGALVATQTGIEPDQLRGRLMLLARHGVPPGEAIALGLFQVDGLDQWPYHVFDVESGWNLAASRKGGRDATASHRVLGDKRQTAERLAAFGLPVVPTIAVTRRGQVPDPLSEMLGWLASGPVHVKDVFGRAGQGAFEAWLDHDCVRIRRYGDGSEPIDIDDFLRQSFSTRDYIVQPRLVSAQGFEVVAEEWDVVTMRVVTRVAALLHGSPGPPRVFSSVLEIPVPGLDPGTRDYSGIMLDNAGCALGELKPRWASQPVVFDSQRARLADLEPVVTQASGHAWMRARQLRHAQLLAVEAHRLFPEVFAVAWDLALTREGPKILEGNTGFASVEPQMIGGGLLRYSGV